MKIFEEDQNIFLGSIEKNVAKLNDINKMIVDLAPVSIITIDKKGIITFANKYYKYISKSKNPINKNIFETMFFVRENLRPLYKKLLSSGEPFTKTNCSSDDKSKYLNIIAVPMIDAKGNIEGALSMAVDVTETVQAKIKIDELNKSLKERVLQKTRELQKINEKLKKSLELKSQFISDASHELRTPLSVAKLNLEFFKKQFSQKNKPAKKILNAIDEEINRVSDVLSDIAFFTAIDEDSVEKMNMEKIDLNKFIDNLAGRIKSLADKKNIRINFQKNKSNPSMWGDKIKLEKLFLNIMQNSIKYGKKSGITKIHIETDLKNMLVKIIFSDNGIGIAKKDLPRIFDRFYRTNISRNDGEGGFGLGLAICKWIVKKHNGEISVKSDFGKGSAFTVVLPVNK